MLIYEDGDIEISSNEIRGMFFPFTLIFQGIPKGLFLSLNGGAINVSNPDNLFIIDVL